MGRPGNGSFEKSICAHDPIITPERKLWRAVLGQAYEDAETPPTEREEAWQRARRLRARSYLRADVSKEAAEMKLVCDFAGLPANRIISWARRCYPRAA